MPSLEISRKFLMTEKILPIFWWEGGHPNADLRPPITLWHALRCLRSSAYASLVLWPIVTNINAYILSRHVQLRKSVQYRTSHFFPRHTYRYKIFEAKFMYLVRILFGSHVPLIVCSFHRMQNNRMGILLVHEQLLNFWI